MPHQTIRTLANRNNRPASGQELDEFNRHLWIAGSAGIGDSPSAAA
jgi:hypothetical protein